jgi:ABC-type Fe3+-hydroxamate transport system substrate-binding protein
MIKIPIVYLNMWFDGKYCTPWVLSYAKFTFVVARFIGGENMLDVKEDVFFSICTQL